MAEAAADKRLERPGNTHPEASPSSAR